MSLLFLIHFLLFIACDDGTIKLWLIPEGGLSEPTNIPEGVLQAHIEKIYCIKFHPLAKDILATTSYDMTTRIWDLATMKQTHVLKSDDQVIDKIISCFVIGIL